MQNYMKLARYFRWLYELSLSVYCAFLFTSETRTMIWLMQRLPAMLARLTRGLFSPDYSFNCQYTATFLVAGIVFVLLRLMGQIRALNAFLCWLGGSAVFLAPVLSRAGATKPNWWPWLWAECAASAVAALLYANRKLPASVTFMAVIVLFHCGLWGYVVLSDFVSWWEYHTLVAVFLLLPLFTSFAWVFYVWLRARPDPTR